jgi:hypothetical protein
VGSNYDASEELEDTSSVEAQHCVKRVKGLMSLGYLSSNRE